MKRVALGAVAILLFAACGSSSGAPPTSPGQPPASSVLASASLAAAATPEPAASAAASAPAVPAFKPVTFTGSSDRVPKFAKPRGTAAIAVVTYRGDSHFAVATLGPSGGWNDLLVNVVGPYSGTVLLDVNDDTAAFQVTASGPWKIVVGPLTSARLWSGAGSLSGRGDQVIILAAATSGLTPATFTNHGDANFVVTACTNSRSSLLVNEIGNYNGEVPLPDATVLIQIRSNGSWSIRI